MADRITTAKALASFKRDCKEAIANCKALNIKTIVSFMVSLGITVRETVTHKTIETGKMSCGAVFSRKYKTGKGYEFTFDGVEYRYDSLEKESSYSITSKLAEIEVLAVMSRNFLNS